MYLPVTFQNPLSASNETAALVTGLPFERPVEIGGFKDEVVLGAIGAAVWRRFSARLEGSKYRSPNLSVRYIRGRC